MRKLASVVVVDRIEAIAGADRIEAAHVGGWVCVVKKGEMRAGDRVVYFEIDSILPDRPEYAFLWGGSGGGEGSTGRPVNFRLTSRRFKGVVSQGLLLPFDKLPAGSAVPETPVGTDLTEALGVTKYDPPEVEEDPQTPGAPRASRTVGGWPDLAPKTEEVRVQNLRLDQFVGMPYVITRKLDGTSATYGYKRDFSTRLMKSKSWFKRRLGQALRALGAERFLPPTFYICSRNLAAGEGTVYRQQAEKYRLAEKLKAEGGRYVLQGEIVGPKIQKNPYALAEPDFFVFNVFDRQERKYLPPLAAKAFAERLGCQFVPVVEVGEAWTYDQATLLKMAEGLCPGTKNEEEGLVVTILAGGAGADAPYGKTSFKAISNRFLLSKKG